MSYITIYEDWNERDGNIYYRWRTDNESEWHEKLTPYKEKPVIQWKQLSQQEYVSLVNSLANGEE